MNEYEDFSGTIVIDWDEFDGRTMNMRLVVQPNRHDDDSTKAWGTIAIPGFVLSRLFTDKLQEPIDLEFIRDDYTGYKFNLIVPDAAFERVYGTLEQLVDNAVSNRVLGLGAGAGAEQHGGLLAKRARRDRKTRRSKRKTRARFS
jgi:hypothetical protein